MYRGVPSNSERQNLEARWTYASRELNAGTAIDTPHTGQTCFDCSFAFSNEPSP